MKFRPIDPKILEARCRRLHELGLLARSGPDDWRLTRAGRDALSTLLATAWLNRSKPKPRPPSDGSNVIPIR
jgi:DNA-binding HxlR family transcriptional regulator